MRIQSLTIATFVGGLLTTSCLVSAQAQEAGAYNTVNMDAVTVYATRSEQKSFDAPMMVSTIDATAPGNAVAGDIADLFEFTPGVDVENGARRNGQTVSIRGYDDEAILTLVDGRRQNFESAHDGRYYIDPTLLKNVEVVKGASSAIYGGGAVGGVLAFETKDAADFLKPGETIGGTTSVQYRTGNSEFVPSHTGYARTENWDFIGNIAYKDSGDIHTGDGGLLLANDKVHSGMAKAAYTFDDFSTIGVQYQGHHNNSQEPNNGTQPITASNPVVNKNVTDHQFSATYEYENPSNTWLQPKFQMYHNITDVREEDISGANAGRVQTREMKTYGFNLDNQSDVVIDENHNHIFSYGAEYYIDQQTGTNSITGARAGVPNGQANNFGAYVQDEITFDTSAGEVKFIPAIRFDGYTSSDNAGNSQDETAASPKIAVSYKPMEQVMLFGSWAQAFRAPNLTELYPAGLHFPGIPPFVPNNNFVANPNLEPETVTTIELGAGVDFKNVLADNDRVQVKGSWYYSEGDDFIEQVINVPAGTTTYTNINEATITGFEISGEYQIGNLNSRVGLSYTEAEDDQTGNYLSNNVPLTLVTDISYDFTDYDSTLGWRGRFAKGNDRVGPTDTETGGYGVNDVYYRWNPIQGDFSDMTVDLAVENVFDKDYTKRFATLREEGRSYVARVAYRW